MKRREILSATAATAGRAAEAFMQGSRPVLALFLAEGLVILAFLFLTVHNRNPAAFAAQHPEWGRYETTIMTWIEKGPFKYGDFRLVTSFEKGWTDSWGPMDPSKDYLYRSYPCGFLRPAYFLQLIHYRLRGGYSQALMLFHNQALVWLSSAGLGFLVFLVAKDLELATLPAVLLGTGCQAVFQTFPFNLQFYWEILHPTTMSVALAWFLVVLYRLLRWGDERNPRRPGPAAVGVAIFLMFYADYITGAFVVVSLLLATRLLDQPAFQRLHAWRSVVLPAALFFTLAILELALVGVLYPDLRAVGSGFLMRSGLDGSAEYVADHWALASARYSNLGRWPFLFLSGAGSVAALGLMVLKWPVFRPQMVVLIVALGAYVPQAFVGMQQAAIHPYAYDPYLALPLIAAFLGFLPACLERVLNRPGMFVLLAATVAFCWSFVQLRQYALAYPLPFEARWLPLR